VSGAAWTVEIDEDEALPGFDSNGNEAVLRAIEILDTFELGHAFQRTIKAVVPAVIRTMQEGSLTARLSHDGSGVMTANIVEGSQNAVVAADHYDGLTRDGSGDELPWGFSPDRCARRVARFC
jgi:hypothetical protein